MQFNTTFVIAALSIVAVVEANHSRSAQRVALESKVTVHYRGKTEAVSAKPAAILLELALAALNSSGAELGSSSVAQLQQRYSNALKRSHILVSFNPPTLSPKAANKKVPVDVVSIMIPFSPDLDPETLYVQPGKPIRAFTNVDPIHFEKIRQLLVTNGIYPMGPGAAVKGIVTITGKAPAAKRIKLDTTMLNATGQTHYTEETWLVGDNNGLANCVVTLRAIDPAQRVLVKPLAKAAIDKERVCYDPRITVVTPETAVVLRNTNSPCNGFMISGAKPQYGNNFNTLIKAGDEHTIRLKGPDICSITCPVRPYMKGYIHVVDTPFYAVTGRDGRFTIRDVPVGEYRVVVWHEAVGTLKKESGPTNLSIQDLNERSLSYKVPTTLEKPN